MGVGLSPVRVCVILLPFLKSLLISSRSQLNISRVFFHDGIGFKYNLVCAYGAHADIYRLIVV